jgi:hypothetical protein
MDSLETRIRAFFKSYENQYRRALKGPAGVDARKLAAHFAGYFVESSPRGAHGGSNGWLFRFMIRRGFGFYRKLGTREMTLELVDVGVVDDRHSMAKVAWEAHCIRKDGSEVLVPFEHIYFLRHERNTFKILAYIANDPQKLLEEHGLVSKKRN